MCVKDGLPCNGNALDRWHNALQPESSIPPAQGSQQHSPSDSRGLQSDYQALTEWRQQSQTPAATSSPNRPISGEYGIQPYSREAASPPRPEWDQQVSLYIKAAAHSQRSCKLIEILFRNRKMWPGLRPHYGHSFYSVVINDLSTCKMVVGAGLAERAGIGACAGRARACGH